MEASSPSISFSVIAIGALGAGVGSEDSEDGVRAGVASLRERERLGEDDDGVAVELGDVEWGVLLGEAMIGVVGFCCDENPVFDTGD